MNLYTLPLGMADAAVAAARESGCAKSQRGAVAFDTWTDKIVGVGSNAPAVGECTGSDRCREICAKVCVHAEMAALRRVRFGHRRGRPLKVGRKSDSIDIVHAKVVGGELVPGGGPSCWQCARDLRHDTRVSAVWLFHEDGWRRYPIAEFYDLTMAACGLAVR